MDKQNQVADGQRRRLIVAAGTLFTGSLAGCTSDSGRTPPEPVTLGENADCDICGMVISKHPGPTTEIFYADRQPNDHQNPARFDSTWEAFQFDFNHDGWERQAFYATDYSTVDYEIRTDAAQPVISTHYSSDAFVDAHDVTFVVNSEVVGAMGSDLIGFSDAADAEMFREEYGGDLATFDDVTPTMIEALGR